MPSWCESRVALICWQNEPFICMVASKPCCKKCILSLIQKWNNYEVQFRKHKMYQWNKNKG